MPALSNKAIDILDISITSDDSQIKFDRPEIREAKIGSERKWFYAVADGGWSELFFGDNWKRSYSEEIMVAEDTNDTNSGKAGQ